LVLLVGRCDPQRRRKGTVHTKARGRRCLRMHSSRKDRKGGVIKASSFFDICRITAHNHEGLRKPTCGLAVLAISAALF
jgi:hypothetical protein